jgi:hypothetical protein
MRVKAMAFIIIGLMLAMLLFGTLSVCGSMVWSG